MLFTKLKLRIDELESLLYIDGLTQCFTKQALEELAPKCVGSSLYITYVDVNGLKIVNDSLGHEKGDDLLKYVSHMLRHLSRKNVVFRLEGGKFVVLGHQRVVINIEEVSYGMVYKEEGKAIEPAIEEAEKLMRIYKKDNFFK